MADGEQQRKKLQRDTILGFLTMMSFITVFQATYNVFQPEPKMWPAVLALVVVVSTVVFWRRTR